MKNKKYAIGNTITFIIGAIFLFESYRAASSPVGVLVCILLAISCFIISLCIAIKWIKEKEKRCIPMISIIINSIIIISLIIFILFISSI